MEPIDDPRILEQVRGLASQVQDPGRPDGAFRSVELQKALGWGKDRVNRFIDRLIDEGRVEIVDITFRNRVGELSRKKGYRLAL